jgi:hypothetical protein
LVVSFLIGIAAHLFLGFPDWITAAIMFNNTTSYPLLLIQSLDETGILSSLVVTDETTSQAIERAKSYFLVFSTISSCLTFAVGPRLIDTEHAPDAENDKDSDDDLHIEENQEGNGDAEVGDASNEQTSLLGAPVSALRKNSVAVSFFPTNLRKQSFVPYDRRPSYVSKKRWLEYHETTRWWLLFFYDFLNAPLLGAVVGAVIGLVPALHRAFFNDTYEGGIFSAWLTASLKNIGGLFVPLPVVVAGVSLYTSMTAAKTQRSEASKTPWSTTLFVLVIRFVIWPVLSILIIYLFAKKTDLLGSDPMLWFALMLMPTGPPAMKLVSGSFKFLKFDVRMLTALQITMVQVSNANAEDENKVSKLLTVSKDFSLSPGSPTLLIIRLDIIYHFTNSCLYSCRELASKPGCNVKTICLSIFIFVQ